MEEYLTELEIAKVEAFVADKVMYDAVYKVLLQSLYTHGVIVKGEKVSNPQHNFALSIASLAMQNPIPDAEIGAQVRAVFAGVNVLKNALDDLKKIKVEKESVLSEYNEAV